MAVLSANTIAPAMGATTGPNDGNTTTPIKHVIIIVGENRSFDHVFATYVPRSGSVVNLLSEGIINADGTPGPNAGLAAQNSAVDTSHVQHRARRQDALHHGRQQRVSAHHDRWRARIRQWTPRRRPSPRSRPPSITITAWPAAIIRS